MTLKEELKAFLLKNPLSSQLTPKDIATLARWFDEREIVLWIKTLGPHSGNFTTKLKRLEEAGVIVLPAGDYVYLTTPNGVFCEKDIRQLSDIPKSIDEAVKRMNWFSNMFPFEEPLIYQGIKYRTVEHFYQAMKTKDLLKRKEIAALSSPYYAKSKGKRLIIREDWNNIKLSVMEFALKWKFKEGTIWYEILNNTKGELVEWNNWGDTYWGKDIKTKEGENNLGKLLMNLRRR